MVPRTVPIRAPDPQRLDDPLHWRQVRIRITAAPGPYS
jgi:hypothetical protein